MNAVVLAHVSDLHLPYEPRLTAAQRLSKRQLSAWSWRRRRHLHQDGILDALVSDIRDHAVDHVAITGDVVNFSLPEEFHRARMWLERFAPAERISLVPGNHDALVPLPEDGGAAQWLPWTRAVDGWPAVHRIADGRIALVGLSSACATAPLLAQGRLGAAQLARLETQLEQEGAAGRVRVVLVHHPVADGVVGWRKALSDRHALQRILRRTGAELVLHGHARDSSFTSVEGPRGPIPCICVPSSSAVPNPRDEGARWHRLTLQIEEGGVRASVEVRLWSVEAQAFVDGGRRPLALPPGR